MPANRDEGSCGAVFLVVGEDAIDSVLYHPVRGDSYVGAVDAVNDPLEEKCF